MRLAYRGTSRTCPICEAEFLRFMPRNGSPMCLQCGSLARHRLLILYLRNETRLLDKPARLLHLAPEPPVHALLSKAPYLTYTTLDLAGGPLVDITADARKMPFEDASFDAIICSHVLEHIEDDERVVREFARVLRPGASALIQIPIDPRLSASYQTHAPTAADRLREYGQQDHVRIYAADVQDLFARSFSKVEALDYAYRFSEDDRSTMGLVETSARRGADIYRLTK